MQVSSGEDPGDPPQRRVSVAITVKIRQIGS